MEKYSDALRFNENDEIENLGFNLCNFISDFYNDILEDLKDYEEASIFFQELYEKIFIVQNLMLSIWELILIDDNDLIIIIKDNIFKLEIQLNNYSVLINGDYKQKIIEIINLVPIKELIYLLLNKFCKVIKWCNKYSMGRKIDVSNYFTNYGIICSILNQTNTKKIIIKDLNKFNRIKSAAETHLEKCIKKSKGIRESIDIFDQIIKTSEQTFIKQMMMMIIKLDKTNNYNIKVSHMITFSLKLASFQVYNKYNHIL